MKVILSWLFPFLFFSLCFPYYNFWSQRIFQYKMSSTTTVKTTKQGVKGFTSSRFKCANITVEVAWKVVLKTSLQMCLLICRSCQLQLRLTRASLRECLIIVMVMCVHLLLDLVSNISVKIWQLRMNYKSSKWCHGYSLIDGNVYFWKW